MHRLLVLAPLILCARPADACEDHVVSRTVEGVAADGSFVSVETIADGRVLETVAVANADGARIAWCERGETDDGLHDTWSCHGDKRFRASGTTRADRVARSWSAQLGPLAPLAPLTAPEGITQAICARTPSVYWVGGRIDCDASHSSLLTSTNSTLVFLRFRVAPWKFCGGTSSHDELTWVSRTALASRLATRGTLFTARNRRSLAHAALEALVWLEPDNADAKAALERVQQR